MKIHAAARAVVLSMLLGATFVGCGQRGPLVLRDDARPIERLPEPAPEPAQPQQPQQPQADDEERRNER